MSTADGKKARQAVRAAQEAYERERDQARAKRQQAFADAQKAGLSLRQIAEEVGLHHSRVADVIRGK